MTRRKRGLIIGAVSTLRRAKRIDVLLDAMPLVLKVVPEARLVVAGEGPLRDALHRQARDLGLDVEWHDPFVPPPARYLNGLDLYVLSSNWEALTTRLSASAVNAWTVVPAPVVSRNP